MVTLPGGISSTIRRLPDLDGLPFMVSSARGAHLHQASGPMLVDFAMAMGATILGHAHPAVVEACAKALEQGSMPGFTHAREEAAAAALVRNAGRLTRATFLTTGSEAVHLACRIARKTTGRDVIAKVAAGFDGWYDELAFGWSGAPEADLAGDRPLRRGMTLIRWNDISDLETLLSTRGDVAAVLIEPMLANAGSLVAEPGYLEQVGRLCRSHGAMVIADEVLMGLRLHPGPSSHRLELDPDLVTLGKAIGSGLPVAAVIGSEDAFAVIADGSAMRAGTFHGNPLVTAAVLATFDALTEADYGELMARGRRLRDGIVQAFARQGLETSTSGLDSVFSLWLSTSPPTRYASAKLLAKHDASQQLHLTLRRHGVLTIPGLGAWGRMFMSFAHSDQDVERTLEAFDNAAKAMVLRGLT
ncbi:MAG: aminotransferase class III-fold pyridoxal phosphate-dependent enzyme [Alsobacter sp.]